MPNDDIVDIEWVRGAKRQSVLSTDYDRMPRMSALKRVLWGFLAVLGAVALAPRGRPLNPDERVNGLWLVVPAGWFGPTHSWLDKAEL
jgi:hypothetical protein